MENVLEKLRTEGYEELLQEDKDRVDAIIAHLQGKTVREINSFLMVVRSEINSRAVLSHQ